MPLRGEGSDARPTKTEGLTRVSEHRARLCEQEEERTKEALRKLDLLRIGNLIQQGDGYT
jgi:hypothetical protein